MKLNSVCHFNIKMHTIVPQPNNIEQKYYYSVKYILKFTGIMKKLFFVFMGISLVMSSCATVQSLVRSTFPYTSTMTVPASSKAQTVQSVSGMAAGFDQVLTGQTSNTSAIKDVRLLSVKLEINSLVNQSLSVFKTIKIYISRGDSRKEHLIAASTDVPSTASGVLVLDADTQTLLDEYIKGSTVRLRLEYELREQISTDIVIKTSLGLDASPAPAR